MGTNVGILVVVGTLVGIDVGVRVVVLVVGT